MAGHSNSALGTGGMRSKIEQARMSAEFGAASSIGPGRDPEVLKRLFSGEPVGTLFVPRKKKLGARKGWLRYFQRPEGTLIIDQGACQALVQGRKSLLPSGIVEVRGDFGPGAATAL